ncbi:MAG: ammonia-forming cytochrome c nitrite reductase subunit c552 [Anaerolineae bacterium]|nr:ammonia-forming cytochrome c nitrite reductase subunit c552 [Anaerolineae bacterium]
MKRIGLKLLILGVIVVATGVVVASAAPAAPASPVTTVNANRTPPEGATYVGSNTCLTCHSSQHRNWSNTLHPHMIQDVAANPKAIVADFKAGEDVRSADIGGQKRAYSDKDVTYTMGNKHRQRYILKTDNGYQVLPGQWNVVTKKWDAAEPVDWLKTCAGCHTTGFDVQKMTWSELSVGCEACHGPASIHVEKAKALPKDVKPVSDEVYAVRQAIVRTVDAAVCGQCHNRGTSPDKEHEYPVGYVVGGPLTDKMFVPVTPTGKDDDPNFWPDGTEKQTYMQYIAWGKSKHGSTALETLRKNDHAADYCVGCHSTDFARQDTTFAQDKVDLKNAQFNITCVQCHAPHGEAHLDKQLNMDSYDLCVSCHTGTSGGASPIIVGSEVHHPMREMFEGRSFVGLKAQPSKHYSNEAFGPVCASCHMTGTGTNAVAGDTPTHTWQIVSPAKATKGQPDSCTKCHTLEKNKDNTPENLSAYIDKVQKDTKKRVDALREDLKDIQDEHKDWDPKANDKPKEQQSYERAVTLVSFVEADGSMGFHNPEFADTILKEAEKIVDTLLK